MLQLIKWGLPTPLVQGVEGVGATTLVSTGARVIARPTLFKHVPATHITITPFWLTLCVQIGFWFDNCCDK